MVPCYNDCFLFFQLSLKREATEETSKHSISSVLGFKLANNGALFISVTLRELYLILHSLALICPNWAYWSKVNNILKWIPVFWWRIFRIQRISDESFSDRTNNQCGSELTSYVHAVGCSAKLDPSAFSVQRTSCLYFWTHYPTIICR